MSLSTVLRGRWRGIDRLCLHTGRDGRRWVREGGATNVLKYLHQQGDHVDSHTYVKVLQRCMEIKDLMLGREVHEHIIRSQVQPDLYVINTLIKMYTHCGSVVDARQVFDKFVNKNVVTWNAMVGGYAQHGHGREAFTLFCQMQRDGLEPNKITYISILNACSSPGALALGNQVHVQAVKAGYVSDVRVGTALVNMYAKCGSMKDARHVFDNMMERDVISWNSLISGYAGSGYGEAAFGAFSEMQQEGLPPDKFTYMSILKACASPGALERVKEIHAQAKRADLCSDVCVGNAFVNIYAKCGSINNALEVFNKMVRRDVISWNAMIGAYAKTGHGMEAFEFFQQMQREGLEPNKITYMNILTACSSPGALEWGKEVHAQAIRAGFVSDVRIGTALVNMYAKCGSMNDARQVFDEMVRRNVISWNAMIGRYAESGHGEEAFKLFQQMQREGLEPDGVTYLSILNACVGPGALKWGKQVHTQAMKAGFMSDVRVGTALVSMFARCGSVEDARLVFEKMVKRNVASWNAMIGGYSESGHGDAAFEVFHQMQREGLEPEAITYMSILNACASPGAMEWGKEVHAQAVKTGFVSDVRVGNALVNMYVKCGSLKDARQVFDKMVERNIISWNVMIGGYAEGGHVQEAFEAFHQMQQRGLEPDKITYMSVLDACASPAALQRVKDVHDQAIKAGLSSDLMVGNALINSYAKCSSLKDARQVFDKLIKRNVISWNALIGGYAENGCGEEAFQVFQQMQQEGQEPDKVTYMSILSSCDSLAALERGKAIHAQAMKSGFVSDVRVGTALVNMYAKCGSIRDAREVFDKIVRRNVISWNAMIGGYAEVGQSEEAFDVFQKMQQEGQRPDRVTYMRILNACASLGALEQVKEVHAHAMNAGLSDVCVGNTLVSTYAKCGSIKDARQVFDRMAKRDVITWNAMISGLAQHGSGEDALKVFEQMKREGVRPNGVTFVGVLSACSHAGLVDQGWSYFSTLSRDHGIVPTIEHYSCMVDLLCRAGYLCEAENFIKRMPLEADSSIWVALLGACKNHGNMILGERAADRCLKIEPQNAGVYVLLSHIYAAAGEWNNVMKVRKMMEDKGVKKEPGRSWMEVEKKVHSFVADDRSHPQAEEIYGVLETMTRKMKSAGYVPNTQLVMHDLDEQQKEQAICHHSEKLAIAYALISTPHGTPIRIFKNLRVCTDCHTATKFISKISGREIVARDASRFHHFKDGVCSCGDYW